MKDVPQRTVVMINKNIAIILFFDEGIGYLLFTIFALFPLLVILENIIRIKIILNTNSIRK